VIGRSYGWTLLRAGLAAAVALAASQSVPCTLDTSNGRTTYSRCEAQSVTWSGTDAKRSYVIKGRCWTEGTIADEFRFEAKTQWDAQRSMASESIELSDHTSITTQSSCQEDPWVRDTVGCSRLNANWPDRFKVDAATRFPLTRDLVPQQQRQSILAEGRWGPMPKQPPLIIVPNANQFVESWPKLRFIVAHHADDKAACAEPWACEYVLRFEDRYDGQWRGHSQYVRPHDRKLGGWEGTLQNGASMPPFHEGHWRMTALTRKKKGTGADDWAYSPTSPLRYFEVSGRAIEILTPRDKEVVTGDLSLSVRTGFDVTKVKLGWSLAQPSSWAQPKTVVSEMTIVNRRGKVVIPASKFDVKGPWRVEAWASMADGRGFTDTREFVIAPYQPTPPLPSPSPGQLKRIHPKNAPFTRLAPLMPKPSPAAPPKRVPVFKPLPSPTPSPRNQPRGVPLVVVPPPTPKPAPRVR
jgi:hypothetical protein